DPHGWYLCSSWLHRWLMHSIGFRTGSFDSRWRGRHRQLHSFPTRRSSDLVALSVALWRFSTQTADLQGQSERLQGLVPLAIAGVDRKSTRLNSSHVKISYAVFCLKKKTASFEDPQGFRERQAPFEEMRALR